MVHGLTRGDDPAKLLGNVRILTHVDPVVLERELLDRIEAIHAPEGVGRTLILVPTQRLARHLLGRLAGRRSAWLGLSVLSFPALAREIVRQTTGSLPEIAPPLLREALLRGLLRELPENRWAQFSGRRPGATSRLLSALEDLREAGIPAAALKESATTPLEGDLAAIHARYDAALAATRDGWADEAGLAGIAREHAAGFGKRFGAIFVHGAYELLGVYLDLLRELDRTVDVTALLPVAAGSRATAYAERFARSFLLDDGQSMQALDSADEARTARLTALYDESAAPPQAPAGSMCFRHVQGAAAEVKFAVREALRAVRAGCPPHEIAITARSLEPYAAALEEALDDAGLPWTSSLESPLRRQRLVAEFLLMLRVAADGFPREPTVTLLQSRQLNWKELGLDRPPTADLADEWSRAAVVVEGVEEWTELLAGWAVEHERNEELAGRIGHAVRAIDTAVVREEASWSRHAERLSALLDRLFPDDDDPAADELRSILDQMGDLERLIGERQAVDFDTARSWLEQAVGAQRVKLRERDGGGIRVLAALQLRGMTFRRLHLLGMNSRVFPRTPREDAVLGDRLRRTLVQQTGRPLTVETESGTEEQLLLALLNGAAEERIDISWQRADESGRAKVSSLALRELARVALGRPDLVKLRDDALHLPSHPKQWLDALVEETGLLAPDEARLMAALHSRAVDAAAPLSKRFPELRPGLDMLLATQAFHPVRDEFDARIGAREQQPTLSVSKIEALGSCPLKFFFANVLRVRPLEEPLNAFEIEPREVGNRIHGLLEEIYGLLRDEGRFQADATEGLVERGLELLDERRNRVLGDIERLNRRLPVLWGQLSRTWLGTVRRFMRHDLAEIAGCSLQPVELENLRTVELDFGEGVTEEVRGKFDRRFDGEEGTFVGDYKISKRIEPRVNVTDILKGRELQVPLYAMMAGPETAVELLGIHPDLDPQQGLHSKTFKGFKTDELKRSFLDTVRVLLRLRDEGAYPLHDGIHCNWCDFAKACRRHHPPTRDREKQLGDAAAYHKLDKKSTRTPFVD